MKVAIEYIRWLAEEQAKINQIKNLDDIEFFENGMKVKINPEVIKQFKFIGLLNTDFILSDYYLQKDMVVITTRKKEPNQKIGR